MINTKVTECQNSTQLVCYAEIKYQKRKAELLSKENNKLVFSVDKRPLELIIHNVDLSLLEVGKEYEIEFGI